MWLYSITSVDFTKKNTRQSYKKTFTGHFTFRYIRSISAVRSEKRKSKNDKHFTYLLTLLNEFFVNDRKNVVEFCKFFVNLLFRDDKRRSNNDDVFVRISNKSA